MRYQLDTTLEHQNSEHQEVKTATVIGSDLSSWRGGQRKPPKEATLGTKPFLA
jgi:hypothetical protein